MLFTIKVGYFSYNVITFIMFNKMNSGIILSILCLIALIILIKISDKSYENFAPISAISQLKYPKHIIDLTEQDINITLNSEDGVTPFQGHQNPIGAEIWYARTPLNEISNVPLTTTLFSPYCCPSTYSTSSGCSCYGNAGKILNNIYVNTQLQ